MKKKHKNKNLNIQREPKIENTEVKTNPFPVNPKPIDEEEEFFPISEEDNESQIAYSLDDDDDEIENISEQDKITLEQHNEPISLTPSESSKRPQNFLHKSETQLEQIFQAARLFRKKPVTIEAVQTEYALKVETSYGAIIANPGDWIVKGVNGEFYPVPPDVFAATYQETDKLLNPRPQQTAQASPPEWYPK